MKITPRTIGEPFLRRQVKLNLASVQGLENIPRKGGFVLVPSHSSYLDHFVLTFLLEAVRDNPTWFLTKSESFERPLSAAWSRAWHGIPVDRGQPSVSTLREISSVLAGGDGLCVYPEGTRNPSPETLLPFKTGAFHFAENSKVPVIPVAMVGTDGVLPRGQRKFHRGRIDVTFGPAVQADPSKPKPKRIKETLEASRLWIEQTQASMLVSRASEGIATLDSRLSELARTGGDAAKHMQAVNFIVETLRRRDPHNASLIASSARTDGLRALSSRSWTKSFLLARAIQRLETSLRISPNDPRTQYYLGVALLANSTNDSTRLRAKTLLEKATSLQFNRDPRALISLAEAKFLLTDHHGATSALALARAVNTDPHHHQRRENRMVALERKFAA